MTKQIISLAALVLFTSSCSLYHVTSTHTSDDFYPMKTTDEVVFIETVEDKHKVIGNVTVNAERRQLLSEVMTKMRREAAILGGDAITDIQTDATGAWKQLPAQEVIGNAYVRANFTASVIVFE